MRAAHSLLRLVSVLLDLARDALQFLLLGTRSSAALKAENIFLRKQLALYLEREAKQRRATGATRPSMVLLSQLFAWQNALINVKPETFLGWHRKGFQLLWRSKSRPRGRPRFREEVQKLIQRMAQENPTWGEERIAAELPGIPDLRSGQQQARVCGHRIPIDHQVVAKAILGGLHREYSLERRAA